MGNQPPVPPCPSASPVPTAESGVQGRRCTASEVSVVFACMGCGRECFDGNMPKAVECVCGLRMLRDDYGAVMQETWPFESGSIDEDFALCTTQFQGMLRDLEIATFGVFADPLEGDTGELLRLELVSLRAFFQVRPRFLSEGECFLHQGSRYKVLSAYPSQGFVTPTTSLACTDFLTLEEVAVVRVVALAPCRMTRDLEEVILQPYLRSRPHHLHSGQLLSLKGLQVLILHMTPKDGLTTPTTTLMCESGSLQPIKTLRLSPYLEDLPREMQRLDRLSSMKAVFAKYIVPYFKGWRRVVMHGQELGIKGVEFRIHLARPIRGYVSDSTSLLYHGRPLSRREELNRQIQQDEVMARSLQPQAPRRLRGRDTRDMLIQVIEMLHVIRVSGESEGASQLEIDLLPTHKASTHSGSCLICLSEYEAEECVRTLPCCKTYTVHFFHKDCVDKWLKDNRLCPVCKTPANYREERV